MLSRRHLLCGLGAFAASSTLSLSPTAAFTGPQGPLPRSSAMAAGELVPAPTAWFALLRRHPELDPAKARFAPVRMTVARAAQLVKVQQEVNRSIEFRDDRDGDLWEVGGSDGDCEDYAIGKLRCLVEDYGFPRGALTLAACQLDRGRGHAVLLVHSDRGVYVLDNLPQRVMPWQDLPYRWVAREEPGAPFRLWRALSA